MAPIDRRSRASEEAGEWLLRLQAGELPREQREALVDWLRESPVHVAELLRMASVHGALEQFEHWTRIATTGAEHDDVVVPLIAARQNPVLPAKKHSGARWFAAAAAIACIAVVVGFVVMSWRGQVIQTDRGERREVALADGSVVQIDPETRLRVKMDEHSRHIHLDTGRALFRVAKNPARPFLVHADATTVRAIGTAFGVERREQGVVVTVAEGKVAVDGPDENGTMQTVESSSGQALLSGAHGIVLVANEQVTLQVAASTPQVRKVDSGRALAWAEGRLIFEDTPVGDVVAQFNRYNSIQIQVQDERLAARPISGVFNAANPEAFIDFIQAGAAVQIRREPGGHIVISSSP